MRVAGRIKYMYGELLAVIDYTMEVGLVIAKWNCKNDGRPEDRYTAFATKF
ncbi:MAG: hypothetical protein QXT35_05565 [Conexivisphaerales archaeon]